MALITLEQAAARIGVPRETVEEWIRLGLLPTQETLSANGSPQPIASSPLEKYVDEQDLHDRVESLGWLKLSAEGWDGAEER
jgi:predicted site-specific integrase-resolvase